MVKILCFVALLYALTINGHPQRKKRYDGHKVLQLIPKTHEEINKILELGDKFNLDIWKFPKYLNTPMDLYVTPEELEEFSKGMKNIGTDVKVMINDIQKLIDNETNSTGHRQTRATRYIDLTNYHSYNTISAYLDSVASASSHAQVINLGQSVEGRDLKLLKISNGQSSPGKKAIFMDGGIHAREWISTATILYMIDQLVFNPSSDSQITTLLNKFDWYLYPMVNPDGYEYSRTQERLWRKNRAAADRFSFFGSCKGVDLNRNFNYHWNPDNGGSRDPCQQIYAGGHAMSEPETSNLGRFLDAHGHSIIAYLNIHSYGELWLYPWGYTSTLPSDWRDLDHLGRVAASAIRSVHGAVYTVGEDTRILYAAAGGADDYAKGHSGIKYAYTVELRPNDDSSYGFVLPHNYIIPSGQETWAGVKAFAFELINRENL